MISAKPIMIHDNVWIDINSIIFPLVIIGKNSIIGVEKLSLVVGSNPKIYKND